MCARPVDTGEASHAIEAKELFEAARASYDQVDSAVASVEAKARGWLGVLTFFFSAGALSLTVRSSWEDSPVWLRLALSLIVLGLLGSSVVAFTKLLKSLELDEYEGLVESELLLKDYKEAEASLYFQRYAKYLGEARKGNAAKLRRKTAALEVGISWTQRVFWVLMCLVFVSVTESLWL